MEQGELRRRFFIAVFPPKSVVKKLAQLRSDGPRGWEWKWPKDYHISLAFPGPLDERRLAQLKALLETVKRPSFDIGLEKTSHFIGDTKKDRRRNPHVLHAQPTAEAAKELKNLRADIAGRLRAAGFKSGKNDYAPHLTLARVNDKDIDLMKQFSTAHNGLNTRPWRCDRFAIYESLDRNDPTHPANTNSPDSKFRKIAEFRLAG